MRDEPPYSPPVDIGGVMVGGMVSRVGVESFDYQSGDWVLGWGVDGKTMTYPVVMIQKLMIIRKIHRGRWCVRDASLPLIYHWISVSLKRAKRWW